MDPAPRRLLVECPECRSPAVHVPWEPQAALGRRRTVRGLALLWLTSPAWAAMALVTSEPWWALPLIAYGLVTVVAGVAYYRSAHGYRCADCTSRWRV